MYAEMSLAFATTLAWRLFFAITIATLGIQLLYGLLPGQITPERDTCPRLVDAFPEYAAFSSGLGSTVAVIADKACGMKLAKELRQRLGVARPKLHVSEESLAGQTYDSVVVYGRGPHAAHRGLRAAVYSSRRLVAVWAAAPLTTHDSITASTHPMSNVFVRQAKDSIALVAQGAEGEHEHNDGDVVDILGATSRGGAATRYFFVWTTDASGWGRLRWLVIDRLVQVVPEAEVYVFANHLPKNHFQKYPNVHLVQYDEVRLFDDTPLAAWASDMPRWKKVWDFANR